MAESNAMASVKLTRDTILDGTLHASVRAVLGPDVVLMSDAERDAQVRDMLARAPRPGRIWVFAFGSLIWNPAFHFAERRTAHIHGYHREFCLWVRAGRGSAECPGLMLSLESGGSCRGVAYRLAPGTEATELDVLWRREMFTHSYRPVWTIARTPEGPEPVIAFSANREHERYAPGLDEETVARHLARACGVMGRGCDYLFDTVAHLRELGIRDRHLESLDSKVRAHCLAADVAVPLHSPAAAVGAVAEAGASELQRA
jgi:cation transport protein ChaC